MKKIFLSFLLVMAGISHTLAQGLDGNVEQRLKDFFTRYETSYANIGKCKLDRYVSYIIQAMPFPMLRPHLHSP